MGRRAVLPAHRQASGRRVTEIAVVFKRAPHLPFSHTDTEELGSNALVIRVQPDEGVTIRFGSKVPGPVMEVRDVNMDFSYGQSFTEASPEAYERLILDVSARRAVAVPAGRGGRAVLERSSTRSRSTGPERGTQPEPVRGRHLGPALGRRHDGPRRPHLAATVTVPSAHRVARTGGRSMIIDLPSTTSSAINKKMVDMREQGGTIAQGRVLTLVIVTDEDSSEDPIAAANGASFEHPCRVIVVARGSKRGAARMDAQIRVGGDAGASEVIVLRLFGRTGRSRGRGGRAAAAGRRAGGGLVARRERRTCRPRIRSAPWPSAGSPTPPPPSDRWPRSSSGLAELPARRHRPGLDPADHVARPAGRRTGPAAAREDHRAPPCAAASDSASADLLAGWLALRLTARCKRLKVDRAGSGLRVGDAGPPVGQISLVRPEARHRDARGHQPARAQLSLPRRTLRDCIAEELRRLDADDVYADVLPRA